MDRVRYSIQAVARRTGLSPHVIRVWERRYRAVAPERTGTNRRYYSEDEVERLGLLRQAVGAGHRIGNIAGVPIDQLRQLVRESANGVPVVSLPDGVVVKAYGAGDRCVDEALEAVSRMDSAALEEVLKGGLVVLGHQGLLCRVVAPLAERVGELWREGALTAAHEHFATALLRMFLLQSARSYVSVESGPCLVVATPAGQLHELGAVMICSSAMNLGWRVAYLGASLPAAEIAGAVRQKQGRAVALSIVYPADDPALPAELIRLREFLPSDVRLIVGGRAASAYSEVLTQAGAMLVEDLARFGAVLDQVRSSGGSQRSKPA